MRKYLKIYIDGHYQRTVGNTKWFMDIVMKDYERDYKEIIYNFITCIPLSEERTKIDSMDRHIIEIYHCHSSKKQHIKKVDKVTCMYVSKTIKPISCNAPITSTTSIWGFITLIYIPKEKEAYNLHDKDIVPSIIPYVVDIYRNSIWG